MIRAYQVKGNHWLAPREVEDAVYPFMGPDKSADDVEHARAALQKVYEAKGYPTVAVLIPEQSVDGGIIRLEVQPQVIGKVTVTGTSNAAKLLSMAPSLRSGEVPNFQAVQKDVIALNSSPGRQVTPDIKAGDAPGTIDVNLKVDETTAWHGSAEVNNYNSPQTTELRVGSTLRYDDLWGRGDSISLSGQTAPERTQDATVASANYLAHLGPLQLLAYYVHSDSNIGIVGGTTVIGKGDMGGLRVIVPLGQAPGFYHSLTAGIDYKDFGESVALGADRSSAPLKYFPFTLAWRGDWSSERAKSYLSASGTFNIRELGDGLDRFNYKRYQASPNFSLVKVEGATTRDTWEDLQVYLHMSGQWSDSPLVSNEELSVGGQDTVRGYYESETLGDYGIAGQLELRSPALFKHLGPLDELRLLAFYDEGYSGIHAPLNGQDNHSWLASSGGGLRIKLSKHFNGSLDTGVPLRAGPSSHSHVAFFRFRVWGEF